MKCLRLSRHCSRTAAWLVLVWLSPMLQAGPAGGIAKQLRDVLERQGWEIERAPDGSQIYTPSSITYRKRNTAENLRQALEHQGWRMEKDLDGSWIYWPPKTSEIDIRPPATTEMAPEDKPGDAQEQPGPQTKAAPEGRVETPTLVEGPGVRPIEDKVEFATVNETKTRTPVAIPRQPEPEQRLQIPRRPGNYGYPGYRPLPAMRHLPPPGGYRRVSPPCPHGPWNCGWHSGRRPGLPAPSVRERGRQNNATDE